MRTLPIKFLFFLTFFAGIFFPLPAQLSPHYFAADSSYGTGDFETAIQEIDLALQENKYIAKYYTLKFNSLYNLDQKEKAFETIDLGLFYNPDSSRLHYDKGWFFKEEQYYPEAVESFELSMALGLPLGQELNLFANLGISYMYAGELEKARDILEMAHGLDSTHSATAVNYSILLTRFGEYEKTIAILKKVERMEPDNYFATMNLGFYNQQLGNYKLSVEYFNKAIPKDSLNYLAYSNRAFSRMKLGDLEGAMEDIEFSIELNPKNSWAFRNRALIWQEMGKPEKMCEDLQESIRLGFTTKWGDEVEKLLQDHCR